MIRVFATYLVVSQKRFTIKEIIVIAISWIPKATVQAAFGGVILDKVKDEILTTSPDYDDYEEYGKIILTASIISIMLTAPFGAVLTKNLGERWLNKVRNHFTIF